MIYVAEVLDKKFVKFGFSGDEDVSKRLSALQTGCPFQINLVTSVPGTLKQEKSLHAALNDALSMMGLPSPPNEWYPGRHGFIQRVISEIRFGVDAAIGFANQFAHKLEFESLDASGAKMPKDAWPTQIKHTNKRKKKTKQERIESRIARSKGLHGGRNAKIPTTPDA